MKMGSDWNLGIGGSTSPSSSSSSSSPIAKRIRDPEEEVYIDNLRSHKRYLSQSLTSSPASSPHRYQRPHNAFLSPAPSTSSNASALSTVTCSQPRQRGSDSEGRFPSSPSDICYSANLRRAALLRSVQMRTHPSGSASMELPFGSGQEPVPNIDTEERSCCPYMKSLVDEREHQIEECSPMSIPEPEFDRDSKPCMVLNMNVKPSESSS
ncbi:hypothetical protein Lalb_Chr21g0309471 [Lupinus albus]|uniref:Uncharacterized protein n=1 Tax=Lupinus albus TaxID=3870 RepID=A0A6A4NBY3_LUPAL|nr:hypothetical protein Lalb_Chr21g0309471 [Lupinus albus]